MAIDESELAEMLKDASNKLISISSERGGLKQFISICNAITLVPSEADPSIFEIPIDIELGTQYTTERREAIFDKLVLDRLDLDI